LFNTYKGRYGYGDDEKLVFQEERVPNGEKAKTK
jgi:hypothetical protein